MRIKYLDERKKLLDLKQIDISNKEWLYMLGEETRHSVAIEGIFSSEEDLDAVIERNAASNSVQSEIINYFRAAQFVYDLALQYRNDYVKPHYIHVIRTLHSQMFRNVKSPYPTGEFRTSGVEILNARITPPFDPRAWMDLFVQYIDYALEKFPIHGAIARIHTLFESIHPFCDGNGRVGRLLVNFILIVNGYCNISIKGLNEQDRMKYYEALEMANSGIEKMFSTNADGSFEEKAALIETGDFSALEDLIYSALLDAMDRCIIIASDSSKLLNVSQVAKELGISETAVKKRIKTGNLIASKLRTGKWKVFPHNIR
ncbi:Fic family protein [uncultured Mesotoga sp.]|uniref:Fic family protein n=1 Tax=uncultured Mesotoga sp. TaxID=1184400 RepID=UPI00259625C0|nr:Fic family protein [uncultured Mesotoga sp.]